MMWRNEGSAVLLVATLVLAAPIGVLTAAPLAVEPADASATSPSPHGKDANFTATLDNPAPGTTGANNYFASGLRERMEAAHTIVLTSEAFQFDSCSASQVRAFGLDRGNDDPGTETDESLLSAYKSITFEKHQITVQFYEESTIAGEPVSVAPEDQVVARGDNCIQTPSNPGWYQIDGKLNGSTNGDTTADFSQSTTSHYIYVCDCDSRQEAEQQLGPAPSDDGGPTTATPTPTTTATPESGDSDGSATVTRTATATATAAATPTPTATPTSGNGGSGGDTGASDSTPTTTPTSGSNDGGSSGGSDGADSDRADSTATASATATPGGGSAVGSGDTGPGTPTVGAGPGFGAVAALGGLVVAALLALRRD